MAEELLSYLLQDQLERGDLDTAFVSEVYVSSASQEVASALREVTLLIVTLHDGRAGSLSCAELIGTSPAKLM